MSATLSVPTWGSASERQQQERDDTITTFPVAVSKAEWERNDHNHADALSITVDWRDAGVDPRLLGNAIVEFYLGCADDHGDWTPTRENRRFIGIATDVERSGSESGQTVEIKALDYTTLFLEAKPFPPEGVPTYDQTLREAWFRIVEHTGGKDTSGNWFKSAELLANALVSTGDTNLADMQLSGSIHGGAGKGPIPVKPNTDAWAVWQTCVGMLGLISWIEQDRVILTTSTNLYSRVDPAVFTWGNTAHETVLSFANIKEIRERRNCKQTGTKICLMSYDPLSGKVLQAFAPSPPQLAGKGRKKVKLVSSGAAKGKEQDRYEVLEFNGITNPEVLQDKADQVYEERSRQELEGSITTEEMFVGTLSGAGFDVLTLGAGQSIVVELEQDTLDGLQWVNGIDDRIAWLVGRGYSDSVAHLLAKNAEALKVLSPVFFTKSVRTSFECDENGGSFSTEITFCNQINLEKDQPMPDGARDPVGNGEKPPGYWENDKTGQGGPY
ncbi:MAG: hypothetical protein HY898_22840 [Deltaproteobacteria bacterium]|nr:hypothetical protein [Deltaproteobacteria bacterium]